MRRLLPAWRAHCLLAASAALGGMTAVAFAGEDIEYGAYLSGECVTCHRSDAGGTIPVLAGRNREEIVAALRAFKSGARPSAVMQQIASRLAGDEMAALAAYFSSQTTTTECNAAPSVAKDKPC
jgi:cytochrome c553